MTEATATDIRHLHHHQTGIRREGTGKYVVTCSCKWHSAACSSERQAAGRWRVHLLEATLEDAVGGAS